MRMASYAPPVSFAWETTYGGWRDNLRWEVVCTPEQGKQAGVSVRMTIRIEPGPLGWLILGLTAPFGRFRQGGLTRRAQRALERARDALIAYDEVYTDRTARRRQRRSQISTRRRPGKAR